MSLILTDNMVLSSLSVLSFQHPLEQFAAKFDAAEVWDHGSLLENRGLLQRAAVGGQLLCKVQEFRYLEVLIISEGQMEQEMDKQFSAASTAIWTCLCYRFGEKGGNPKPFQRSPIAIRYRNKIVGTQNCNCSI